jgi:hypothetical protein
MDDFPTKTERSDGCGQVGVCHGSNNGVNSPSLFLRKTFEDSLYESVRLFTVNGKDHLQPYSLLDRSRFDLCFEGLR